MFFRGQPHELIESRQNYDPHNDPPDNPWYPAVRNAGRGGWRLSVSLAKGQDQPVLVSFYYQPFHDSAEALRGVLVAGITLIGASEFLGGLNVSLQGKLLQVNHKMTTIFGYRRDELERMTVNDLALPEDEELSPKFIQQAAAGTVDSVIFETNLRCLLRDCIRDLAPLAEAKGLALHLELDAGLPACIQVDGQRLRQILDNLLGNAAKFTGQGEIRLQAEAVPGLNHSGPVELRITVADTGPGITATDQERIFAAFVQIAPGGGSAQGSGLGLAISRQLSSLMGGRIRLDSALGAGSRFTLTLPAVPLADGCAGHGPASGDRRSAMATDATSPAPSSSVLASLQTRCPARLQSERPPERRIAGLRQTFRAAPQRQWFASP